LNRQDMSSSRCGRMKIMFFTVDAVSTIHQEFSCFCLWRSDPAPEILKRLEHACAGLGLTIWKKPANLPRW
jgi:hypothetical protein